MKKPKPVNYPQCASMEDFLNRTKGMTREDMLRVAEDEWNILQAYISLPKREQKAYVYPFPWIDYDWKLGYFFHFLRDGGFYSDNILHDPKLADLKSTLEALRTELESKKDWPHKNDP